MINLAKDIRPVSYIQSHTDEILKRLEKRNSPVVITQDGEAKAVLMDVKQYQHLIDTISLLKILSVGEDDLKNRRTYTHAELDGKIRAILD